MQEKYNFEKECEKLGVNSEFVKKLKSKLSPILEKAIRLRALFNKTFLEFRQEMHDYRLKNVLDINDLFFGKIKPKLEIEEKEFSLLFLIHYLFMIEGPFTLQVDTVAYSLVASGKKLYSKYLKRNVHQFRDLESTSLSEKLRFLKRNGLGIISDSCDRKLRNHIAHLTFKIDKEGTVHLKSETTPIRSEEFNPKHEKLRNIVNSIHMAIEDFYYEKYVKKKTVWGLHSSSFPTM